MMLTEFFPAGMVVDFRNINMEEMEFYARAWSLERIQMQKGLFCGSMIAVHTPRIQLMRAPYSHGVLLQGDFPKGTVLIAAVATKATVTFQNRLADKHEIKILQSGDEIDFLSNGESETFTLAIEEAYFDETYYSYFGYEFDKQQNKNVYIDPILFAHFINGIAKWIEFLIKDYKQLKIKTSYEYIELEILRHVFSSIYIENAKKTRPKFQIKNIRDILHQSIEEHVSIGRLIKELDVSERLVYHAFQENYGITPKKYYSFLRLHKIKQELLLANPKTDSISQIVSRYNIFNMSAFSDSYKKMFGELPSNTLQRQS